MAAPRRIYPQDKQAFIAAYKLLYQEPFMLYALYPWRDWLKTLTDQNIKTIIDKLAAKYPDQANRLLAMVEEIIAFKKRSTKQVADCPNETNEDYLSTLNSKSLEEIFKHLLPGDVANVASTVKRKTDKKNDNLSQFAKKFVNSYQINELPLDRCYTLLPKRETINFTDQKSVSWHDIKLLPKGDMVVSYVNGFIQILSKNDNGRYVLKQALITKAVEKNTYCLMDVTSLGTLVTVTSDGIVEIWNKADTVGYQREAIYNLIGNDISVSHFMNNNLIRQIYLSLDGKSLAVKLVSQVLIYHKNHHHHYKDQTFSATNCHDLQPYGETDYVASLNDAKLKILVRDPVTLNYGMEELRFPASAVGGSVSVSLLGNNQLAATHATVISDNMINTYTVIYSQREGRLKPLTTIKTKFGHYSKVKVVSLANDNLLIYNDSQIQVFVKSTDMQPGLSYVHARTISVFAAEVITLPSGNCLVIEKENTSPDSIFKASEFIFPSLSKAIFRANSLESPQVKSITYPTDKYKRTASLLTLALNLPFVYISLCAVTLMAIYFAYPITEEIKLAIDILFSTLCDMAINVLPMLIPYQHLNQSLDNLLAKRKTTKALVSIFAIVLGIAIGAYIGYVYSALFAASEVTSFFIKAGLFIIAADIVVRFTNVTNSATAFLFAPFLSFFIIPSTVGQALGINGLELLGGMIPPIYQAMASYALPFAIAASLIAKYSLQIYYKIHYRNTNADGEGVMCRNEQELAQFDQKQAQLFGVKMEEFRELRTQLISMLRAIKISKFSLERVVFLLITFVARDVPPARVYRDFPLYQSDAKTREPRNALKDVIHGLTTASTPGDVINVKEMLKGVNAALTYNESTEAEVSSVVTWKNRGQIHSNSNRALRMLAHQYQFFQAFRLSAGPQRPINELGNEAAQYQRAILPFIRERKP